jgi:hypothetical protein
MADVDFLGTLAPPAGGTLPITRGEYIMGAVKVVANAAARDAIATAQLRTKDLCLLADTGIWYQWSGAAWAAYTGFISTGVVRADGTVAFTADQSMGSNKLTNLTNGGTGTQDAATVAQTEALIAATVSGVGDWKQSVRAATTANITLSGAQVIDGVSVVAGDRALVKNQTTGSQNGIYVAAAGAWSRSTDADASAEVTSGLSVLVEEGTAAAGKIYILTTANPIVLGTTALTFNQISTVPPDGTSLEISGGSIRRAALTGDVTASAGSNTTAIAAGVIVDADVNAAAAIAGSKISPDFVAQNVYSTGYFGTKDNTAIGGTGGAATFRAADATGASGTTTGGALTVRAGNGGSGSGTRVGGAATFASGTGTNADGDLTLKRGPNTVAQWVASSSDYIALGNLPSTTGHVRMRNGFGTAFGIQFRNVANTGNVFAIAVDNTDTIIVGDAIKSYQLSSAGVHSWITGSAAALSFDGTSFRFGSAVAAPVIGQTVDATATVTGKPLTLAAQDCSGATLVTAGALTLRAGDATGGAGTRTGGALTLRSGTGGFADGNVNIQRGSAIGLQLVKPSGGLVIGLARTTAITATHMPASTGDGVIYVGNAATSPTANPDSGFILWSEAVSIGAPNPVNSLCVLSGEGHMALGDAVHPMDYLAGTAGHVFYNGGSAVASIAGGNVSLGNANMSAGGGSGVVFLANRTVAPTSDPVGGGILYVESGALKYRGSAGNVVTLATA